MERPLEKPLLSPRELQIIESAAEGLTDTAIAYRLGISEATVGTYWGRVRTKLGPFNRTELVSIHLKAQQETALAALREENARLQSRLNEPNALADAIIENAPDAILLVNEEGDLLRVNAAARELFGYGKGELEGLPLVTLIPVRYRTRHQEYRRDYTENPQRKAMGEHLDTPALHRTGAEFSVRATLSAMATDTGTVITCLLRKA